MNCFDGCKYADVENKPVTCSHTGEELVVRRPYFECNHYESESEDTVDVLYELQE